MKSRSVAKFLLFLFLGILALESGFVARDYLRVMPAMDNSLEQLRILVISDSVFGDANQAESLYSQLQENLKNNSKKNIVFYNASLPANSSAQAVEKIDPILQSFRPNLSIVLLGNSDYVVFNQSALSYVSPIESVLNSVLYKFRTYHFIVYSKNRLLNTLGLNTKKIDDKIYRRVRTDDLMPDEKKIELQTKYKDGSISCIEVSTLALVALPEQRIIIENAKNCSLQNSNVKTKAQIFSNLAQAYHKIRENSLAEMYFDKALSLVPDHLNALNSYAWYYYQNKNCSNAIKYFEKSFLLKSPERRPLMVLKECYIQQKLFKQGQDFFSKLSELNPNLRQITDLIAKSFDVYILSADQQRFDDNLYARDRDFYITKLYFYKKLGDKTSANELFKQRDRFPNLADADIDISNYEVLLKKIISNNSKVIALQYPNQSNWQVQEAISFLSGKVQFISLGDIIESKIPQVNVIDIFQDDFMHLSDTGAKVVAEDLSAQIISYLNLESNK